MTSNNRYQEPIRYQPSPQIGSKNDYQMTDQQIQKRQQMSHVNVVVNQPGRSVWRFEHKWSNELCSCCTNMKQCCFAFFCSSCFECKLHERAGENMCTCMCPGALFALRTKIRTAFRIEGDLCNDCCVSAFCPCCTTIQLTRELHHQGL